MNKEKQIEEMANSICGLGMFCFECDKKGKCRAGKYAKRAYNAGYRKASDILDEAYEILKELKDKYRLNEETREACAVRNAMFKLAELKDKYTEDK